MQNSSLNKTRRRIFDIIQIGNTSDRPSRYFDIFIAVVIIANVAVLFLETFQSLSEYFGLFDAIDDITVSIFIVEYILRIWTADFLFPEQKKGVATLRFITSANGIIELLTILPFFFLSGMVVFRMLRVVRIFHLFRLNSHYDSFSVIRTVLNEKKNQILSSLFIIFIVIMASSLLMYNVENKVQPESFENAFSGLWWSVSTILTIGYGDIYPVTILGKILGVIISFLGVFAVALPTGIISAGFVEQYQEMKAAERSGSADLDMPTHNVMVDIDSRWIGKSSQELEDEFGLMLVLVRRGSSVVKPTETYHVEVGDMLVLYYLPQSI